MILFLKRVQWISKLQDKNQIKIIIKKASILTFAINLIF
jgi:hypothetical protein